jgi:hypothetical protein
MERPLALTEAPKVKEKHCHLISIINAWSEGGERDRQADCQPWHFLQLHNRISTTVIHLWTSNPSPCAVKSDFRLACGTGSTHRSATSCTARVKVYLNLELNNVFYGLRVWSRKVWTQRSPTQICQVTVSLLNNFPHYNRLSLTFDPYVINYQ